MLDNNATAEQTARIVARELSRTLQRVHHDALLRERQRLIEAGFGVYFVQQFSM